MRAEILQKMVAEVLIEYAKKKQKIAYSDFKAINGIGRRQIGKALGPIGHKCKELKLPKLPAIVIYKRTGKTGDGFIGEFYSNVEPKTEKAYRICKENIEEVFSWQNWDELSKYYNSII